MTGDLIALAMISLWCIPKMILEVWYFKDRWSARETLLLWFTSVGSICLALGFSFLFNYLS